MRRLDIERAIDVDTIWGGRFSGVLPEAVSSTIWRFGFFDVGVSLTLLKSLGPGSGFVDVGAHFGYFSLFASSIVGKEGLVLAVEAMPSTHKQLAENVRINASYPNIKTHQGAAFDKETELEFNDFGLVASSLNSAFGSRGNDPTLSNQSKKVFVKAKPLDTIVSANQMERIDLVKIDAESSEKFVIMGMDKIIRSHRPVITTEVGDVDGAGDISSSEIISMLEDKEYTAYRWTNELKPEPYIAKGPVQYDNLVFVPVEKLNEFLNE